RSGQQTPAGNFYRELTRLVADRLLCPASNPPGADPRRVPYEITDRGRWTFDEWMCVKEVDAGLGLRLLFLEQLKPTRRVDLLRAWRSDLSRSLDELRARRVSAAARRRDDGSEREFAALLLSRQIGHIRADIEFLDAMSREVRGWASQAGRD